MKKLAMVLVSLLLLGGLTANAEGLVVKAGANFTKIENIDSRPFGWQAGVGFQTVIPDGFGFTFQPELLYKVIGFEYDKETLKRGYIELPLNVQMGYNFGHSDHLYPFVFAGPYVGVAAGTLGGNWGTNEDVKSHLKKVEYGLGLGAGINLWILQFTAKYNWNFGAIADTKEFPDLKAPHTIELCIGFTF